MDSLVWLETKNNLKRAGGFLKIKEDVGFCLNFNLSIQGIQNLQMKSLFFIIALLFSITSIAQVSCELLVNDFKVVSDSTIAYDSFIDENKKIGRIENSKSEFEIRYYYSPSLVNGGKVTIITCIDGNLQAKKIDYWFNPKKPYDKWKINKVEITELTPSKSWPSFFHSLDSMNFFEFPTMDEVRPRMIKYMLLADGRTVEKRSQIMDGANYTYQVKVDNNIRTFSYHSPMAWYQVYDNVEELKIADDIKNLFVNGLKPKD
ncbi:multicopper oxidase domain-containing protein [Algoriphagus yeomjeoni]|uniref:Multicopper oxidase n=1 Tax=Algoriphagus yeomjeoni TaxID=291403 RepID=A0A327PT51_9BACT|nr:multicopper oxidase domain-containing protein [Algoriphagus yeomjeoni]RAI95033.1 multicopper oxidase [Algoriphagus yeomjeoni]